MGKTVAASIRTLFAQEKSAVAKFSDRAVYESLLYPVALNLADTSATILAKAMLGILVLG